MSEKRKKFGGAWVDPDDAPEITDELIARSDLFEGDTLIRRGRGRPLGSGTKESTTIRLDTDVLHAFKASGRGWQTRINDTLRRAIRPGAKAVAKKPLARAAKRKRA
jgi:uncharacterized protein (DUF4415 family)